MTTHGAVLGCLCMQEVNSRAGSPEGVAGDEEHPLRLQDAVPGGWQPLAVPRWSVGGNLGSLVVALDEWAVEFGEIIKEPDSHNAPDNK